jgi:hypothetical protein
VTMATRGVFPMIPIPPVTHSPLGTEYRRAGAAASKPSVADGRQAER